jgi:hypothetical protein
MRYPFKGNGQGVDAMRMIGSMAVAAALAALTLPGPASAADNKRGDGLTNKAPQATEFSSRHRRWHRPRVVRRYYRYPRRYYGRYYRYPRSYGGHYAYAPYPYYYGPRFYGPGFSFGFSF